jgi:hypothetical protein
MLPDIQRAPICGTAGAHFTLAANQMASEKLEAVVDQLINWALPAKFSTGGKPIDLASYKTSTAWLSCGLEVGMKLFKKATSLTINPIPAPQREGLIQKPRPQLLKSRKNGTA